MAYNIIDIEGIGPAYAEKLKTAGINTTDDLLSKGGTRAGRKELADATGIDDGRILTWVNHCDLHRIDGIAGQISELMESAGVDTVKELATRNAANLAAKMLKPLTRKYSIKISIHIYCHSFVLLKLWQFSILSIFSNYC